MAKKLKRTPTGNIIVSPYGEELGPEYKTEIIEEQGWGRIYTKGIDGEIKDISATDAKILLGIWLHSEFDENGEGNFFHATIKDKQMLVEKGYATSTRSVEKALKHLCDEGFLIKEVNTKYKINHNQFYKGPEGNRKNVRFSPNMLHKQLRFEKDNMAQQPQATTVSQ